MDDRVSGISLSTVQQQDEQGTEKLLQDVDQTEIFELGENSTKLQCPDCKFFLRKSGSFIAVAGEI